MWDPTGKGARAVGSSGSTAGGAGARGWAGKRTLTQNLPPKKVVPEAGASKKGTDAVGDVATGEHDKSLFGSVKDLGLFGSVMALKKAITGLLDGLAPDGTSTKLELSASVDVEGIVAKFSLAAEVGRDEDGLTLEGETSTMFGVGLDASKSLGITDKQQLEIVGKDADTCVNEIALYADLWLRDRQWTEKSFTDPRKWVELLGCVYRGNVVGLVTMVAGSAIADLIFGRSFEKLVVSTMAEGNKIERMRTVSLDLDMGFGSEASGNKLDVHGGVGLGEKTTWEKVDGVLEKTTETGVVLDFDLDDKAGPVGIKLAGNGFIPFSGEPVEVTACLAFDVDTKGPGDWKSYLVAAYEMAKTYFTIWKGTRGRDEDKTVQALWKGLFGPLAMDGLDTCLAIAEITPKIGIEFSYKGIKPHEFTLSVYQEGEFDEKDGVVAYRLDLERKQQLKKWTIE